MQYSAPDTGQHLQSPSGSGLMPCNYDALRAFLVFIWLPNLLMGTVTRSISRPGSQCNGCSAIAKGCVFIWLPNLLMGTVTRSIS